MTDHTPNTTGESLEQLIERVTFADPVTHPLRERWEATRREVQALFETAFAEEYERRLDYYRTCGENDADERARREAALIRPLLAEEREQRLALVWAEILRRVRAVLAGNAAAAENSDSAGSTADSSGR